MLVMRMIAAVRDVLVATVLVVGAPVVLTVMAGPPVPRRLPWAAAAQAWLDDPLNPAYAVATARLIAWLVWAVLAAAILACLIAWLRRLPGRLRRLTVYLPPPVQGLTATMVGAAAVTTAAAPAAATASDAAVAAVDTRPSAGSGIGTLLALTGTAPAAAVPPIFAVTTDGMHSARREGRRTCRVQAGDTLFDLAEQHLGDGNRWPQIYALNRGTRFPGVGGTLTDPDLIYPGWELVLPDTAKPGRQRSGTPGARHVDDAGDPAPRTPTPKATQPPASGPHGDDGVVPPPTSPDSAVSTAASAVSTTSRNPGAGSAAKNRDSAPAPPAPQGTSLPSGSWMDYGLALAIVVAAALVWAHRRRRYTPRPPSAQPRLDDPNLAPMPPIVGQLRRRLRRSAPDDQPDTHTGHRTHADSAARTAAEHTGTDDEPATETGDATDGGDADNLERRTDTDDDEPAGDLLGTPAPMAPALHHALIDVWPPAGLGLTGPGAEAAARGFLVAALAAGGLDNHDARTQVVMPSTTAATLLAAADAALPATPRLVVTADLDDALDLLEAQTLHRTRLAYRHEADDLTALRAADPDTDPLPPILLIADPGGRHERTRIAALLTQGQRLDIHGVLLGSWPDGDTVTVAADGTTTPADRHAARHGHRPADVGRLTVLTAGETADLITTLAESHTGQPQPRSRADSITELPNIEAPQHATGDRAVTGAEPARIEPAAARHGADEPATAAVETIPPQRPSDVGGRPADGPEDAEPAEALSSAPRVQVTVLGRPGIVDADPRRTPRAKSMELLVYLAVKDGAAPVEDILDDLLPEARASKALHRLHTYVSDLRGVLRHNAGPGAYITHPNHRYALNTDTLDVDLWRMRAALRDAETADTDADRITALRRAVDTYRGPLADGCDYEWAEPYREGIRHQALDAATALADLLTDQPADQLAVLETAIGHNPYAEPLYQAAMRAHAALGHLDAIRGLRRDLTRRLAEIDAEAGDDTLTLADHLVTAPQRTHARNRPGQAGRADGAAA